MKDFAADAYISMLEMTNILADTKISRIKTHAAFVDVITKIEHARHEIGKNHYAIPLSNGNMYVYHRDRDNIHSISFFEKINPTTYKHALTVKGHDNRTVDDIYKNIQFVVNNGKVVTSDSDQTRGGRNLWRNMHNHVKYGTASLHDMTTGNHVKDVENFEELSKSESDPYIYAIKK